MVVRRGEGEVDRGRYRVEAGAGQGGRGSDGGGGEEVESSGAFGGWVNRGELRVSLESLVASRRVCSRSSSAAVITYSG